MRAGREAGRISVGPRAAGQFVRVPFDWLVFDRETACRAVRQHRRPERPDDFQYAHAAVLGAQQIPVGPAPACRSLPVISCALRRAAPTLAQFALPSSASIATEPGGNSGVLVAPADGVIVSVDRPAGSVVKAGESVVTEYASASLSFIATVPVKRAKKLRIGMAVLVDGPGLGVPIKATVGPAQPNLDGTTPNVIDVKLVPLRLSDVLGLVPGLGFTATVSLANYPKNAASVLGAGP
jgi:HlyD family secretion protein